MENIVLENQQKIRMATNDSPTYEWDIRVDISGAEEDV